MAANKWSDLIELLDKNAPVVFDSGLSAAEIKEIEKRYAFRFPPDLRDFLQTALPKGVPFPDWRSEDESHIREMLDAPLHGVLFDFEHNDFWLPEWGSRPTSFEDAKRIVERQIDQAPRLVPIYAHRMIPDRPQAAGNPVLSVHQTDIIYYGFDLDDYFRNEFKLSGRKPWPSEIRPVEFWEVDRWQDFRSRYNAERVKDV